MKLSIAEIFEAVSKIPARDRVQFLRNHTSPALHKILILALHPDIRWLLPEGAPPYTKANTIGTQGMLYTEARKLDIFLEGGRYPDLPAAKRETLFVQFLGTIHPADAELILAIKDKKMPYPEINKQLVNEAFPGLINK